MTNPVAIRSAIIQRGHSKHGKISACFLCLKIASALILPPTSLILLAFVGLRLIRRHPRAGKTLIALALTTPLFLSLPITSNALMRSPETNPPITKAQLKNNLAIVILCGGKNNNATEVRLIGST